MLHSDGMQVERETQRGMYAPVGIYERIFRQLKPRTPTPEIVVEIRQYANANAQVQLLDGKLRVRMAAKDAGVTPVPSDLRPWRQQAHPAVVRLREAPGPAEAWPGCLS